VWNTQPLLMPLKSRWSLFLLILLVLPIDHDNPVAPRCRHAWLPSLNVNKEPRKESSHTRRYWNTETISCFINSFINSFNHSNCNACERKVVERWTIARSARERGSIETRLNHSHFRFHPSNARQRDLDTVNRSSAECKFRSQNSRGVRTAPLRICTSAANGDSHFART